MEQILVDFGTVEFLGIHLTLRIFGYGLMLVLGFLSGIALAQHRARRCGESPDQISYVGLIALIAGVVGARAAFVIEKWGDFHKAEEPFLEMINITSGGLIYYGGLGLATLAVLVYLRVRRLPMRRYLDIIAPSLMVGLAFGRAGCLLNGCCFGGPARADWIFATRFPMYSAPLVKLYNPDNPYSSATEGPSPAYSHQWESGRLEADPRLTDKYGLLVAPRKFNQEQIQLARSSHSLPVKPAQALGIISDMLLAGILIAFGRLRRREGQVFLLLLVIYPIIRFLLEGIRSDLPWWSGGHLTHNQVTSMILVPVALVLWVGLRRLPASVGPYLAGRCAHPAGRTKSKGNKS